MIIFKLKADTQSVLTNIFVLSSQGSVDQSLHPW